MRLEQDLIAEKQRVDYGQRLLQLQQQVEVGIRERAFLEARCAGLDRDYTTSLARESALTEEAQQLRQKYTTLEYNYDILKQNFDEVSQNLNAQSQILEVKNRELIECQLRLKMAEDNLSSLQKTLSAAEDKIVALRDDYLFVVQEKANLEGQVKRLLAAVNEKRDFFIN